MRKKAKLFFIMVLSCLAVASSAQAGYMGLSPEAGEALIIFVLFCGAVMLVISLIISIFKWLKAKIKKWASDQD
ncbi:MAG: hypothetical protein Q8N77_01060 [Nanoarchaeota archaeon]|nr:hypothetical protein [Nanoarchaeota archaeon]